MTVDGTLYLLAEGEDPARIQRDITAARTGADFVTARLSGNGSLAVLVNEKVPKDVRFDNTSVDTSDDA
jgi:hypothetical protein